MSINYQFGDVDAHGALIRAQAASLEAEHQAIIRDVLAAGDLWGGAGSTACQEFITQLGRNFQVIYEQANAHGQKVQTAGSNFITQLGRNFQVIYEQANAHGQKVQTAGSNMASTDSAVGSSWT
ncbi:WXG100 family type VII secretion target [Mycobacterium branderi]|nr:WXG100 family type VII secretion target [Mycobacterium branderi]MCV7234130.1 WXG100 family type VII secretion target [Mycobacterium branderi]